MIATERLYPIRRPLAAACAGAAVAVLGGLIGLGGAALASAQEAPSTTTPGTTAPPSAPAPNSSHDGSHCQNMGGSSSGNTEAPASTGDQAV